MMQVCTRVCGKAALIASGKPFSPSTTAIRMSLTPRLRSSLTMRSQNLAPSVDFDPQTQHLLAAVRRDAECQVDRLVAHHPLVAHLDPDGVKEHHRIQRFQRTRL